jgi:carbon storage regulator
MLVLTRKSNEAVVVGGAKRLNRLLKVTVIEVGKGKVRLGFEAADDVAVHRLEVWEQIQANGTPCQKGNGNGYR